MNSEKPDRPIGLEIRMLIGLIFGIVAAALGFNAPLNTSQVVFLIGSPIVSLRMGPTRFLVAGAIWLGQYSTVLWRFHSPAAPSIEAASSRELAEGMFALIPAMVILVGTYAGFLVERFYKLVAGRSGT